MKQLINLILLFMTGLLLYSCSKPKQIDPEDLQGSWYIKTYEDAKVYNIANIRLFDREAWIFPFSGDTLYFYPKYELRNDSLFFFDIHQETFAIPLEHLKGNSMILGDLQKITW